MTPFRCSYPCSCSSTFRFGFRSLNCPCHRGVMHLEPYIRSWKSPWNPQWRYRPSKTLSGVPSIGTSNLNGKWRYHWTGTLLEGNIQPDTISKGLIHQKTRNEGNIRLNKWRSHPSTSLNEGISDLRSWMDVSSNWNPKWPYHISSIWNPELRFVHSCRGEVQSVPLHHPWFRVEGRSRHVARKVWASATWIPGRLALQSLRGLQRKRYSDFLTHFFSSRLWSFGFLGMVVVYVSRGGSLVEES
jgi:hypothetical protein